MVNFTYHNLENKFKKRKMLYKTKLCNCSTQDNRRKYIVYHYMKAIGNEMQLHFRGRNCHQRLGCIQEGLMKNCVLKVPRYRPIRERAGIPDGWAGVSTAKVGKPRLYLRYNE